MLRSSNSHHSVHLNTPQQTNHRPKSSLKSKSLLYRNRSLKQFFGDLPALDVFPQTSRAQPNYIQKQNTRKRVRQGEVCSRGKEMQDEYLLTRRKGGRRREGVNDLKRGSKYKRNDIVGKGETNSQNYPHLYDPSPYQWRKSKSKNKHQRQSTQPLPQYQPLIVQSQYYPTPKSSRNQGQVEQSAVQPVGRQQQRCNSSESMRKGKVSNLKPRVAKHIFQGKGVRKKEERLLFTFGI